MVHLQLMSIRRAFNHTHTQIASP